MATTELARLPGLESDRLDAELRRPRPPAHCDEQLVAGKAVARLELEGHLAVPRRRDGLHADPHVHPALDEGRVNELRRERLVFDICAMPFGSGFYVSEWFWRQRRRLGFIALLILAAINQAAAQH